MSKTLFERSERSAGVFTGSDAAKVLRQTYMLLSVMMAFSGFIAFVSMKMNLPSPGLIITLVAFYGLFYFINKMKNGIGGILLSFVLTGFLGYTIGPALNSVLSLQNGAAIIAQAFSLTALVFFSLSAYVLMTGKDMSFLGGFLVAGFVVLLGAVIASLFFSIPGLSLAISAGFVLFSSAAILYETSAIVHGGERNYVMATVSLFVSIFNLFMSLLSIIRSITGQN